MNTKIIKKFNFFLSEFLSNKQNSGQSNDYSVFSALHTPIKNIIFGNGAERLHICIIGNTIYI